MSDSRTGVLYRIPQTILSEEIRPLLLPEEDANGHTKSRIPSERKNQPSLRSSRSSERWTGFQERVGGKGTKSSWNQLVHGACR
jgi:hypothetical protein